PPLAPPAQRVSTVSTRSCARRLDSLPAASSSAGITDNRQNASATAQQHDRRRELRNAECGMRKLPSILFRIPHSAFRIFRGPRKMRNAECGMRNRIEGNFRIPHSAFRNSRLRSCCCAVALAFCLLSVMPAELLAAGNESSRRAHDLVLTVDTRWAGGANGG